MFYILYLFWHAYAKEKTDAEIGYILREIKVNLHIDGLIRVVPYLSDCARSKHDG